MKAGEFISSIICKKGYKPSEVAREIGISRQLLSLVISGKRECSLSLSLKLESFLSIPEGKILKLQIESNIKAYKINLKELLLKKLIESKAFWSYEKVSLENVPDEILIEKALELLDMNEIAMLFEIYSRSFVRSVWEQNMAIQGDYLKQVNTFIARYYWGIRNPEEYLNKIEKAHIDKITKNA